MDDTPAQEPAKHEWITSASLVIGMALGLILDRILMDLLRAWAAKNGAFLPVVPGGLFTAVMLGAGCPLVCIIMVRRFLTRLVVRGE